METDDLDSYLLISCVVAKNDETVDDLRKVENPLNRNPSSTRARRDKQG